MSKHTPPPWQFEPGDYGDPEAGLGPTPPFIFHETPEGDCIQICTLDTPFFRADSDSGDEIDLGMRPLGSVQGNADLILSAPDLLAACESMVATFHDHPDRDEASLSLARNAIAKAKGGAA